MQLEQQELKKCIKCGHIKSDHSKKYGCMVTYKSGMENCDCDGFKRKILKIKK